MPYSIEYIGSNAFVSNTNLWYIYFAGNETGFGNNWTGGATLLPRRGPC